MSKGNHQMNNRIAQVIALIVMLLSCAAVSRVTLASAQSPQNVHITGMKIVHVNYDDGILERAYLMVGIGSVIETDACEVGTHVFDIAFEIYPEIYVDEITLENNACADEEIDSYELVNWHHVLELADTLEPLVQDNVYRGVDFPITGVVTSNGELYNMVHEYNDEFGTHMIWNGSHWDYWEQILVAYMPAI